MTSKEHRVFRFAPSPNGYLHLGHAYSALLNFDLARQCGGRLLLRIEDIDTGRARPEFEAAIYEDLAWLGLDWERPVRRQSEHFGRLRPRARAPGREGAPLRLRLQAFRYRAPCCWQARLAARPGWLAALSGDMSQQTAPCGARGPRQRRRRAAARHAPGVDARGAGAFGTGTRVAGVRRHVRDGRRR